MSFCPNCGSEVSESNSFCSQCGANLSGDTKISPEEIQQIRYQLREERKRQGKHLLSQISFNHEHILQVIEFMKNNAWTLFFMLVLFLIPWGTNYVRLGFFAIYLLIIYFYPLITGKMRFQWDESLDQWLSNQNNIVFLKEKAKMIVSQTKEGVKQVKKQMDDSKEKKLQKVEQSVEVTAMNSNANTQESSIEKEACRVENVSASEIKSQHRFKFNFEAGLGIVFLILGLMLVFICSESTYSMTNQLSSILSNGELSSEGMFYICGFALSFAGILMSIGGLIKAFSITHAGGGVLKGISLVLLATVTGIAIYLYCNPLETAALVAETAMNSNISLSDSYEIISNFPMALQSVPWVIGLLYVIGIIFNLVKKKK